jgi:alkylation response protein AidB-like acyl-CoA dehydrogenase
MEPERFYPHPPSRPRLSVEQGPYPACQRRVVERRDQQLDPGIEHPVVHDRVARVAGRVEDAQARAQCRRLAGQLPPGEPAGKPDIGEQQPDAVMVGEEAERARASAASITP